MNLCACESEEPEDGVGAGVNTTLLSNTRTSLAFHWHSKKVRDPQLCPRWLTESRAYHPSSVIYRLVGRESSDKS